MDMPRLVTAQKRDKRSGVFGLAQTADTLTAHAFSTHLIDGLVFMSGAVRQQLLQTISLGLPRTCLLYTSPSPRDSGKSRMPSSA